VAGRGAGGGGGDLVDEEEEEEEEVLREILFEVFFLRILTYIHIVYLSIRVYI
jgi:hypothetical protein